MGLAFLAFYVCAKTQDLWGLGNALFRNFAVTLCQIRAITPLG